MLECLPERIKSKISVDGRTGCWLWTAATDRLGYGRVNVGKHGRAQNAHRFVYQLLVDDPVGLDLDHLCRVRNCVNPDHLEPVEHEENLRRGIGGEVARQRYAEHLWCPKGHPLFGPNLYAHTMRSGYVNKQCRECRARRDKEAKARRKEAVSASGD